MAEGSPKEYKKALWEKEKFLITSSFSFSHSVFKRLVLQTRKHKGLFGKGQILVNLTENSKFVSEMSETLWEKEKMLVTSIFFISFNVFFRVPSQAHYKSLLSLTSSRLGL